MVRVGDVGPPEAPRGWAKGRSGKEGDAGVAGRSEEGPGLVCHCKDGCAGGLL